MAENVEVKIVADISELQKELAILKTEMQGINKKTDDLGNKFEENLNKKASKAAKEAKKGFSELEGELRKVNDVLGVLGFTIGAAFAVNKIKDYIVQSAKAYDEAIKAEKKLLIALDGRNDLLEQIIKTSSKLQDITIYGDDESYEAAARMATILKYNKDRISDLLPLVQDLATAKSMDLATAADLVARAIAGEGEQIGRTGIEIRKGGTETERFDSAMKALSETVGGQAVEAAKVGLGSWQIYSNFLNDAEEQSGKFSTTILNKVLPSFTELSREVNKSTGDLFEFFGALATGDLDKFAFDLKTKIADAYIKIRQARGMNAAEIQTEANKTLKLDEAQVVFAKLKDGLQTSINAKKQKAIDLENEQKEAASKLAEAEKKAAEEKAKKDAELRAKEIEENEKLIDELFQQQNDAWEKEAKAEKDWLYYRAKQKDQLRKDEKDKDDEAKKEADKNLEDTKKKWDELQKETTDSEQLVRDQQYETLSAISQIYSSIGELQATKNDEELKNIERRREAEIKAAGDNAVLKEQINERYNALITSANKKFYEKEKKMAIAKAIIDGALAMMKIAAVTDPYTKWIQMAAQAAITATQIATISAQKFKYGGYGVVEGNSHQSGGVYVPGVGEVEGKEFFGVLNKRVTPKYQDMFGRLFDAANHDRLPVINGEAIENIGKGNINIHSSVSLDDSKHLKSIDEKLTRRNEKEVRIEGGYRIEKKGNLIRKIRIKR